MQKFELEFPIELNGSTVKALVIRPPGPDDNYKIRTLVIAYWCDVLPAIIEELDVEDLARLEQQLNVTVNRKYRT